MRQQRGITLIELLIGLVVVSIVACSGEWRGSAEHAEGAARAHAKKLGWEVKGVACAGTDTDGDGYISCTVVLEDSSERALECESGGMSYAKGCKKAPLVEQNVTHLSGSNNGLLEAEDF